MSLRARSKKVSTLAKEKQATLSTPLTPQVTPQTLQRAQLAPSKLTSQDVTALQRSIGNSAVSDILAQGGQTYRATPPPLIQTKLSVGPVNDPYEQEADRVATQVMRSLATPDVQASSKPIGDVARASTVQCKSNSSLPVGPKGGEVDPATTASINQARSSGKLLKHGLRAKMESTFNTDFTGVKIHTDARADTLNRAMGARAFTTGKDIFFKRGEYNASTHGGQKLLAHELTHVVQQNGAGVQRKANPNVIQRAVGFEFETMWGSFERTTPKKRRRFFRDTEPKLTLEELGSGRPNLASLSKGKPIVKGSNFEMQADLAGHASDVEFVTDPPGFKTPDDREKMAQTMTEMVNLVSKMEKAARKYKGDMFSAKYIGGTDPNIYLEPPAIMPTTAKPQVTGGILLEKLPAFFEEIAYDKDSDDIQSSSSRHLMGMGNEVKEAQALSDALKLAHSACDELQESDDQRGGPALEGLLTLIVSYLLMGARAEKEFAYAKHIAVIMARTDFSSLFMSLPDADRTPFEKQPDLWTDFVLKAAGMDGTSGDDIFGKDYAGGDYNPTRGEWIGGICDGVDLMSDKGAVAEGKIPAFKKGGQENEVFEGMGRLGDKMEPVGPEEKEAGIFELRRIKGDLAYPNWPDFATSIFDYLTALAHPDEVAPSYQAPKHWNTVPSKKDKKTASKPPKSKSKKFF